MSKKLTKKNYKKALIDLMQPSDLAKLVSAICMQKGFQSMEIAVTRVLTDDGKAVYETKIHCSPQVFIM